MTESIIIFSHVPSLKIYALNSIKDQVVELIDSNTYDNIDRRLIQYIYYVLPNLKSFKLETDNIDIMWLLFTQKCQNFDELSKELTKRDFIKCYESLFDHTRLIRNNITFNIPDEKLFTNLTFAFLCNAVFIQEFLISRLTTLEFINTYQEYIRERHCSIYFAQKAIEQSNRRKVEISKKLD
jgi:hypothetical protein